MTTRCLSMDEVMQRGDIAIFSSSYIKEFYNGNYSDKNLEMIIRGISGSLVSKILWINDESWWVAVLRDEVDSPQDDDYGYFDQKNFD